MVLCDVRLPDGNGVELIAEIKRVKPLAEVIMLTAHGNIPDGVQAIKNGAFDYLTKGDDKSGYGSGGKGQAGESGGDSGRSGILV